MFCGPKIHSPVLQGLSNLRKTRVPQIPTVCPRKLTKQEVGEGWVLGEWGKCALKGLELLTIVVSIIWVRIAGAAASPGFLS